MVAQMDRDFFRGRPRQAINRTIAHLLWQGRPLTTAHPWLNRVLFAGYGLAARVPAMRRVEKPVFILGTGRSGTTILGMVLAAHPKVTFLNEPKALWQAACPLDDCIGSYSRGRARYTLDRRDATPRIARTMRRLYAHALETTGGRRVVDKYPELLFRIPYVQAIFPDARFLLLIRDGQDTVRSIARWSRDHAVETGGERHDWWGRDSRKWRLLVRDGMPTDPVLSERAEAIQALERDEDRAAVEWTMTMRAGLRLRRDQPERVHEVRFETLCRQPRAVLRRAAEFCGLGKDERFLGYAERVLTPRPSPSPDAPPSPIDPHPLIRDVFEQTMADLEYAGVPSRG